MQALSAGLVPLKRTIGNRAGHEQCDNRFETLDLRLSTHGDVRFAQITGVDSSGFGHMVTTTLAPTLTRWYKSMTSELSILMQPLDTARPMVWASLVP